MSEASGNVLRFGDCELDLDRRELRRDGEPVPLEPRVFDLLAYLIEQRHRAVDKDEIQDAVWAGVIVSETALTRAIMKARRAVGDSAEQQAVIRTVHGHGYQFVASPAEDAPAEPLRPAPSFRGRVFAAAIAITLIGFIAYLWPDDLPADSVHLAVMPVENLTGDDELEWTRLGLMGFASDLLAQSTQITVMRASDAIRFTEINGLPDDQSAASDLEELRDIYGASHLLRTRLQQNAGVLRLTYVLHSLDGGIESGTMVGPEPTSLMRGAARTVSTSLGARSGRTGEFGVISADPFINEAYSRGRALALEGRCAEALELYEVVKSASDSISRAHYQWANCARILGRWQEAEAALVEILDTLPAEPATTLRALAHHGLGTVYIRTGRGDAARATLLAGLDIAQEAGDRVVQGMILNNLAIHAKDRREYDEARELLARATVAHTEANRGIRPGQLPSALANIDMEEGKFDQAEQHLTQALEAFRATGDRRNEAMMLNNFGYLRRLQGRIQEAEPLHLESLAIRREIGDRVGQGRILGMLSVLYESEGRYAEAKAAASEAFEIASEANDKRYMGTSLAQLAQAEFNDGWLDAARAAYVDAKSIFEEIGDVSRAAQVDVRLSRIDVRVGDLESAQRRVDDVLSVALREAAHEPAIEARELVGDIALLQDNPHGAIAAYRGTLQQIDETGFVVTKNRVTIKLANLLLDRGDLDPVEPLIGYLLDDGQSSDTIRVRARYAHLRGDAARAVELMESLESTSPDEWVETDTERLAEYRAAMDGHNP